ncbi:MAG: GDP-L-fucose synthase [Micropepsaceae bacterium]
MTAPEIYALKGKRVFVAGHRGMAGSAIVRRLEREDCEILTIDRAGLDLRRQGDVEAWFAAHRPQAVFLAAGTVGGILANATRPAEFLGDNLAIELNVIEAAYRTGIEKLLFLGSSCIYPKFAHQPIREEDLLSGPLEPTNEPYAIAKIAGVKLCEAYRRQYGSDFISVMPTNLYGPGDSYEPGAAHVLPALIDRAHKAKQAGLSELVVWGTGTPRREFLYVDDLADASVFLMQRYSGPDHVNVGYGDDIPIADLAQRIAAVVGFAGKVIFDASKPDGTPRKLLDTARLNAMGWRPSVRFEDGIAEAYRWYLGNIA